MNDLFGRGGCSPNDFHGIAGRISRHDNKPHIDHGIATRGGKVTKVALVNACATSRP
jgi:hypothetical protein